MHSLKEKVSTASARSSFIYEYWSNVSTYEVVTWQPRKKCNFYCFSQFPNHLIITDTNLTDTFYVIVFFLNYENAKLPALPNKYYNDWWRSNLSSPKPEIYYLARYKLLFSVKCVNVELHFFHGSIVMICNLKNRIWKRSFIIVYC